MGNSNVDKDKHMVVIYGIKVTDAFFPSLDETTSAKMEQLFRTLVPEVVNIPAQQQRQTTRHRPSTPQPNSAATQQHSQYSNQTRSSSSTSTQNLNSEIQSRYQRSSAGGSRTRSPSGAGGARRR